MDKKWKQIHENPPSHWREEWRNRMMIDRADTDKSAQKKLEKYKRKYPHEQLKIGLHPKDGYVIYY